MESTLNGLIPATLLPMNADGAIDEAALRHFTRWISEQGPVALAINADTGEGPHLTQAEKVRVLEVVREETDLPLVAGVAGPFTAQAEQQARDYRAAGASLLLVFPISAYLSAPLDPRIPVEYHKRIADVGLPLILFQLQPALAGVNFDPDTLRQLIAIDGVVAMKEASFDARRYIDTARLVEETAKYRAGEFTFLTGNDNFIFESFVLGCTGALIGFGSVMVAEQVRMIEAWHNDEFETARELGRRVQRLADVVFAAPVSQYRARLKEVLSLLGVLESTAVRPPLIPIGESERVALRACLEEVGLLGSARL
jgi:4-hydroxy-tetrahydrodipicolinate synthase